MHTKNGASVVRTPKKWTLNSWKKRITALLAVRSGLSYCACTAAGLRDPFRYETERQGGLHWEALGDDLGPRRWCLFQGDRSK